MAFPGVILAAVGSCALSGAVHGADGTAVRAHVVVSGPVSRAVDTDAQGRFSIELPCGSVRLSVAASGYASADVDVAATGGPSNQISRWHRSEEVPDGAGCNEFGPHLGERLLPGGRAGGRPSNEASGCVASAR